jgi:hypothetical protein
MQQYRITTRDLTPASDDDCYLSPDDPIHALMGVAQLGGIGSMSALENYNALQLPAINQRSAADQAIAKTLQPGTDEWFKFHFGRK